jgi:hypothetical protein
MILPLELFRYPNYACVNDSPASHFVLYCSSLIARPAQLSSIPCSIRVASIDNLNKILSPLYDKSLLQLSTQLTPLDAAKLHSAIAYSLATLEVTYLQLSGVNPEAHSVRSFSLSFLHPYLLP